MPRKYVVHIDGKPLTIAEQAPATDSSQHLLILDGGDPRAIEQAISALEQPTQWEGAVLVSADPEAVWKRYCANYRFVQAAGGCVTDERGHLLAIHRMGRWDLPKGKVDEGESVEEAAVREVMEECGLRDVERGAHLCATWHTYERKGARHLKRTDWYRMHASSQQPLTAQAEEDITEVRWLSPAEVEAMKAETYPSLLPVIAAWQASA